jgi:energy-coupling factor transporter ATP-binding protein EcfA2
MAEFDLLLANVHRWIETAPAWPPFDRARALWARISPRLDKLRIDLDRVLVVGVVGGTGTGKSTLLNALVGQRVCAAGDIQRPTTTRPVVLAHPDTPPTLVSLDGLEAETHRLALPMLEQMVLIDCPDPDTQSRHEIEGEQATAATNGSTVASSENQNLDILRRVLPHCDVLVCTGTAQKYKTQAVVEELLRHAPGRQAVFVQTHAAVDADITADWKRHLESQGFEVPQMFRLDAEEALTHSEQHRRPPAEFNRLVDFLNAELVGRARHRILRANALDLMSWFLTEVQHDVQAGLAHLEKLEQSIKQQRSRQFEAVRNHLKEQLSGRRGVWRARLLREASLNWSWGPFASFLRLMGSLRGWISFLPALRARGLAPMVVAGGIGAGKAIADRVRESWIEGNWLASAELGIAPGDLAQSESILAGFAHDAGIECDAESPGAAAAAAERLYQNVEAQITAAIEKRASRKAGIVVHGLLEILFAILPAVLLWRLAKNFFYDHLWLESSQPLLGLDFLAQSLLWVLAWGLLLRGLLAWRLQRGLARDIARLIDQLTPESTLGPLFDRFALPAATIRQHILGLGPLRQELDRLNQELQTAQPSQLGRLRARAS